MLANNLNEVAKSTIGALSSKPPKALCRSGAAVPSAISSIHSRHPAPPVISEPAPMCPVEKLAREHKILNEIYDESDREKSKLADSSTSADVMRRARLADIAESAIDREYAIREEVSFYQATSIVGALFQISVAAYQLDTIGDEGVILCEAEEPATKSDLLKAKKDIQHLVKVAHRNLHSAIKVLRDQCSEADIKAIGVDAFIFGPGQDHERVSAIVRERLSGGEKRPLAPAASISSN